jgi:pimeloyl-ACP methyl ester carboxylesterase
MSRARNGAFELAFDVEGTGPNVLLIAGTAATRPLWSLVRPLLNASFSTIAFDNRDSGDSTIASQPYSFADLAADAAAVLDAAGVTNAHVVGHSMGGVIAQEFALAYPRRCTSLTLVCSWARTDTYARNAIGLMQALCRSNCDERTLLAAILWAGAGTATLQETDLWQWTDTAMELGPLPPRDALVRQWALDLEVDTLERLPTMSVPAHVIWCDEDHFLPQPSSQRLIDAIPNARETRIAACGHSPMVHRPDVLSEAIAGFLSEVE